MLQKTKSKIYGEYLFIYITHNKSLQPTSGRVAARISESSRQVVFESELASVQGQDVPLQAGDIVTVYPVVRDKRVIRITGAVRMRGITGCPLE